MSKQTILQSLLDELAVAFDHLRDAWSDEDGSESVDKTTIVSSTNSVMLVLRTLRNSDLGEHFEATVDKMKDIKKDLEGLEWSAAYAHLVWLIDEMQK